MRGVADVDRLRLRRTAMDDGINPFEYRDVDCSGRSLATLLVAWVGAAMVASVLLRWKYMWIALTILTLLFLFACGYAACNARRVQDRVLINEDARMFEHRRRETTVQSVSGSVDNCAEATNPPAYENYWISDLPPPYAVVIGVDPPVSIPPAIRSAESEVTTSTSEARMSNPPPYSVAIQSEPTSPQLVNQISHQSTNRAQNSLFDREQPIGDEPTNSRRERLVATSISRDEDKAESTSTSDHNSQNNSQTALASQYLSNILSCTFGRSHQRRNPERNNSTVRETTRDRPDIYQLNASASVSPQDTTNSASRINASTL